MKVLLVGVITVLVTFDRFAMIVHLLFPFKGGSWLLLGISLYNNL